MQKEYIEIGAIISARDLLNHWIGISEDELAGLINARTLNAYKREKTHRDSTGSPVYSCTQQSGPMLIGYRDRNEYGWDGLVFFPADVERVEKANPKFMLERLDPRTPQMTSEDLTESAKDYTTADTLTKRWNCDPSAVLGILGSGKNQLRFSTDESVSYPLSIDDLQRAYVSRLGISSWESKNKNMLKAFSKVAFVQEKAHDAPYESDLEVEAMKVLIARLQSENERLLAENAALKSAAKKAPIATEQQTAKATTAKQEKTAKDWSESLEKAVSLGIELSLAGKPKSTVQHKTMWAKLWDETGANEPRREGFRAFRRGLPDELKQD